LVNFENDSALIAVLLWVLDPDRQTGGRVIQPMPPIKADIQHIRYQGATLFSLCGHKTG